MEKLIRLPKEIAKREIDRGGSLDVVDWCADVIKALEQYHDER